jgi:ABC-type transport system involved in cytochrome c biogenesis permease subunit
MLIYAIVIFAIAAVGGLVLASSVLRGKLAPWAISLLHAALGASGLVLLILEVLKGAASGRLTAALGLLVLAALGGFYLASLHLRQQIAPKGVVFVHAGIAVVGFLTLLSLLLG